MLQHIYPEQITSNVTYSLISKRAIAGKRLHDLSSYTVIIIADILLSVYWHNIQNLGDYISDFALPGAQAAT